ncbi:hypothetical protein PG999_009146 [Apiospora kogelbergensis]|uniref:Rhodopsin domain-containing protein n=1 Tax=Apiospora kogelbergensis TaxID=1337665 RepID=A0AAW0QJW4_9PEZI
MSPMPAYGGGPGSGYNASLDKGTNTLITIWIVTSVAMLFTTGRFVVACGLATKAVFRGLGRHLDTLLPQDQSAAAVWTFAAFFPGLVSFACPKLAVIALLVRLLLPSRPHFWFLWSMGVAVQLAQFGTMGLFINDLVNKCKLFDSAQTPTPSGHCVPMHTQVRYYIFAGSLSAFADFYLAAYPSIVLYHLHMPDRKKVALSIALGFGVVSGAVATYKTTHIPLLLDPDFTYANGELQLWTLVEGGIIVTASSIPILQPLVDKVVGARLTGRSRAFVTKRMAIFSNRRQIATGVRRRIKDNQVTTTTDFTTVATQPEGLTTVHQLDSRIDGMACYHPSEGTNDGDGHLHITRSEPLSGVVENFFPKE